MNTIGDLLAAKGIQVIFITGIGLTILKSFQVMHSDSAIAFKKHCQDYRAFQKAWRESL